MTRLTVTEAQIQAALVEWLHHFTDGRELVIHIPNEAKRSYALAGKLRAQGLRAGVSDLFLPVSKQGFHGLWLELKSHGKKPRPAQYGWLRAMVDQDYACAWADNLDTAMHIIMTYMETEQWQSLPIDGYIASVRCG